MENVAKAWAAVVKVFKDHKLDPTGSQIGPMDRAFRTVYERLKFVDEPGPQQRAATRAEILQFTCWFDRPFHTYLADCIGDSDKR
ncbi:hypothetical protein H2199_009176 [Coniosporium tulheliwenetii]|uniref:Uncharacterized protein n=1 Tax=Coniosporium tulheliwenetii TaxID=3383036 RepID=A0ACC2YFC6_9PEZI|nr:hypothetical protein H2199_009176 [Cladosporium sp. JES 115]